MSWLLFSRREAANTQEAKEHAAELVEVIAAGHQITVQSLKEQIADLTRTNQELLNRIQSSDAATFAALQTATEPVNTEQTYYPKSDEGEAAQVEQMYSRFGAYRGDSPGIGDTLFDDVTSQVAPWLKDLSHTSDVEMEFGPDDYDGIRTE